MNTAALVAAIPILLAAGRVGDKLESSRSDAPPRIDAASISATRVSDDSVAKAAYEQNCRKCHGPSGVPSKAMLKKFPKIETFDPAFFSKRSDDSIVTVLTKGTKKDMKSFQNKLSHDEMKAVAAYIRTFAK